MLPTPASASSNSHGNSKSNGATRAGISRSLPSLSGVARTLLGSRRKVLLLLLAFLSLLLVFHRDDAVSVHLRDAGYLTRPLWDKIPEPFERVIHLQDEAFEWITSSRSSSISSASAEEEKPFQISEADLEETCEAHDLKSLYSDANKGTTGTAAIQPPKVYDAVIFSVELDLLEIRIRELYDVVDHFIIVESNVTFSGQPKPFTFQDHRAQFDFAKEKIIYGQVSNLHVYGGNLNNNRKEDPFDNEIRMRVGVSSIIRAQHPLDGSIIIQSDVDEIPSARAISLLKYCTGWGDVIHLGMPSYLYSFEFPLGRQQDSSKMNNGEGMGPRQWRASAKRFGSKKYHGYTHSRQSNTILEKAGWHMTFAFKYIDDFIFKMQ